MKMNTKHYTLIFFAILTILFSAVGYYVLYKGTIKQSENSLKVLKDASVENEKKKNDEELMRIYSETEDDRQMLSTFFIHEDSIVEFIEKIESIGPMYGVEIDLSSLNREGEFTKARLDVEGSWSAVMKTLVSLENLPYSSTISDLSMNFSSSDLEKSKTRIWNMSMNIKVLTI